VFSKKKVFADFRLRSFGSEYSSQGGRKSLKGAKSPFGSEYSSQGVRKSPSCPPTFRAYTSGI